LPTMNMLTYEGRGDVRALMKGTDCKGLLRYYRLIHSCISIAALHA